MSSGGRSLFYAEPVESKWFSGSGTLSVHIVREATLSPDLSAIQTRRLRSIRVNPGDNRGDTVEGRNTAVDMNRDAARRLRDALTAALDATEKEAEL